MKQKYMMLINMISHVSMTHIFSYLDPETPRNIQREKPKKKTKWRCLSDNKTPPHIFNVEITKCASYLIIVSIYETNGYFSTAWENIIVVRL